MFEVLFKDQPALFIPVVALGGTALVFLVWIIAFHWKRVRQIEAETALKQDMLARGLSVDEIERVLCASSTSAETREVVSANEYYLVEKLIDAERPIEEITQLVRAFKGDQTRAARNIEAIVKGR